MTEDLRADLAARIDEIRRAGTYKTERILTSAQGPRIRVQVSAAHTREDLDTAAEAFIRVGRRLDKA